MRVFVILRLSELYCWVSSMIMSNDRGSDSVRPFAPRTKPPQES